MAKKDKITYINGTVITTYDTFNVHHRVGRGGDNRHDDVMLVQALFRLIALSPDAARNRIGVPIAQLPEITGSCDIRTQNCIRAFQWTNRLRLLNPHDGLIHPASYENRHVVGSGLRMAITMLSGFAQDALLMRNLDAGEMADGLIRFEPRLRSALT